MAVFNKFLHSFLAIYFFWLLQQSGVFKIHNVNPNLLLLVFLLLIYSGAGIKLTASIAFVFAFFAFVFSQFWFFSILLLLSVAVLIGLLKKFLTGNKFVDFLISIFFATAAFAVLNNIHKLSFSFSGLILGEIFYNLILGVLGWILFFEILNVAEKFQQS